MSKIFISTAPFGSIDPLPLRMLQDNDISFRLNETNRRYSAEELQRNIGDAEVLIAGTEPVGKELFDGAPNLKLICRVGIGLDNVDLLEARRRGIMVSYTPEAPAPAVAELALGLMLSVLRHTHEANALMHERQWKRFFGRRIENSVVGVIGFGRIGGRVVRLLKGFSPKKILVNDIKSFDDADAALENDFTFVDKATLLREADIVSLHVPLTSDTKNLLDRKAFSVMKAGSVVVNTSRGGIVNEADLSDALASGKLAAAAIDVFENEPYSGPLCDAANCLLTSHMGSMSFDCRATMEIEATSEALRFINGKALTGMVPASEYEARV